MWYDGKNALFVDGPNFAQVTTVRIGPEDRAPRELVIPVYQNVTQLRLDFENISKPTYIKPESKWYTLLAGKYPFVHCYSVAVNPTEETYNTAVRLIEILVAQDQALTASQIAKGFEERYHLMESRYNTIERRLSAIVSNHRLQDFVTEDYEEDYE